MAVSNSWNSIFQVGSHHLAREFLKMGHEVAFISAPISPLHVFSPSFSQRWSLYRSGGLKESNLWAYVPATLLPPRNAPLLRSAWIHRHWPTLTFPNLIKKVRQRGFDKVDLLYFDTPLQSFWLKTISARKTVYRMADCHAGFKKVSPAELQMEQTLIKEVDEVVCTAKTLLQRAPKAHYLPNGVPLTHFQKPGQKPLEYQTISNPIVVYVGALDDWFDLPLVKQLAKEMPHLSFMIIGPAKPSSCSNLHFLGPKPYSEIPNYLQFADVGIIPFDVHNYPELVHSVNPLKLYEYMASGLPVVATHWKELEEIGSPALLSRSFEEFKAHILQALATRDRTTLQRFIAPFDWSTRALQLIDLLHLR